MFLSLQRLLLCCSSRSRHRGASMAPRLPGSSCSSHPSLCSVILPLLLPPPPPTARGSTTPCQPIRAQPHLLHHIISVSKVTGLPAPSPSLFPLWKVPHHHPHPSHPSIPPSHTELVASLALACSLLAPSPPLLLSLSAVGLPQHQRHLPPSLPPSLSPCLTLSHPLCILQHPTLRKRRRTRWTEGDETQRDVVRSAEAALCHLAPV